MIALFWDLDYPVNPVFNLFFFLYRIIIFKYHVQNHNCFTESKEKLAKVKEMLLINRCKLEELLSREDAVAIKDHLVQDEIINLSDNENLLKHEKRFQDKKSSLISEVIEIVISKLHLGSYQCLTESLVSINNTKRQEQIDKILKDVPVADSMQSGE